MSIEITVADALVKTTLNEDGLKRAIYKFRGRVIPDNMIPGMHGYTGRLEVAKHDDFMPCHVVADEEGRTVYRMIERAVDGRWWQPRGARAWWVHHVPDRSITAELGRKWWNMSISIRDTRHSSSGKAVAIAICHAIVIVKVADRK